MKKKDKPLALALALSIVALALGAYATYGVISMSGSNDDETFQADVFEAIDAYVAEKTGQPTGPVDVSVDDDPAKGSEKAPVIIVEFTDYQCPFCKRYATETLPQIVKDYVDTGKVRYVLRDFPLGSHTGAGPAANAAECLREQGGDDMYFQFHDVLFENQADLSVEKLKEYASDFDIDSAQFADCVDNNKFAEEIGKDFSDGNSYGVRGTPAFFVNGELLAGAQPYENFKAAIDKALEVAK